MLKINKLTFYKFWFPVIGYAAFIFYLSSIPKLEFPVKFPFIDKAIHIIEYLILGYLLTRAITNSFLKIDIQKIYFLVIIIAILYGISDEFHQSFVPGRIVSIGDVFSDGIGGLFGVFAYIWRR